MVALAALAGLCGGAAFLMRHLGLLLLPWGAVTLWLLVRSSRRPHPAAAAAPLSQRERGRGEGASALIYTIAFLLAIAPQIAINTLQAGQPLYNQQAKNVWLAVYGGTDWGRWDEAPNAITLAEVVLRDPARFLDNWWRNVVGYTGSGAEDTSEFGRAQQLRLLGWPANWLAAAGLLGWSWLALRARSPGLPVSLLALVALYVAAVSTAFTLQRFFLPLVTIYALAAGWALWRVAGGGRALLGATLALVVVLWGGFGAGAGYVLANQPADEVAAVQMVQAAAEPDAPLAVRASARVPLASYSALSHRVVAWPPGTAEAPPTPADLDAAREAGARYLLWDEAGGPPPLPDPEAARVATSARYALYKLDP
jgi:hypothetical protein